MKKIKFLLLILLVYLFNITICHAWRGDYNYEVTSLKMDSNNVLTIEGWAILNGRTDAKGWTGTCGNGNADGSRSGVVWAKRANGSNFTYDTVNVLKDPSEELHSYGQSGSLVLFRYASDSHYFKVSGKDYYYKDGYCTHTSRTYTDFKGNQYGDSLDGYTYRYSLALIKHTADGKTSKVSGAKITAKTPNFVSLTFAQSEDKMISNGRTYLQMRKGETACYEDVGFKFAIDMNSIPYDEKAVGYSLQLTVKTGSASGCENKSAPCGDYKCSATIDLQIFKDDLFTNIDGDLVINPQEKVKIIVYNGTPWKQPGFSGTQTKMSFKIPNPPFYNKVEGWKVYDVLEVKFIKEDGVNWYKLSFDGREAWVPSSWVFPASYEGTIIKPPTPAHVDVCESSVVDTNSFNDQAKVCDDTRTNDLNANASCPVTETNSSFYRITCEESIGTDFQSDIPETLKAGLGFSYQIEVTNRKTCTGSFDTEKWKEAYNLVEQNLSFYAKGTEGYYENLNKKNRLIEMVSEYNSWDLTSNTNIPEATLTMNYTVKGKAKSKTYQFEVESNATTGNYSTKKQADLGVNDLKVLSSYVYNGTNTVNLIPKRSYINLTTGDVSYSPGNNYLDGGNKFYLDMNTDPGIYTFKIVVSNLGKNGKSQVTNEKCSVIVTNPGLSNSNYRTIDVSNPFIKPDRGVGINWLNERYDFTKVIDEDTWDNTVNGQNKPLYTFQLKKADIASIKKSNDEMGGAEAYLGTCYIAPELRDAGTSLICNVLEK